MRYITYAWHSNGYVFSRVGNEVAFPVLEFAEIGMGGLEELPNPPKKTTITVLGHGNLRAWMGVEEVLREATPEAIQLRHEQAKARIVECRDASCWCRRFDEQPTENP